MEKNNQREETNLLLDANMLWLDFFFYKNIVIGQDGNVKENTYQRNKYLQASKHKTESTLWH